MTNSEDFSNWLLSEIERRNLTYSEVARRAGISHGRISQVIAGDKPGWGFCKGIAGAFRVPPEDVFRKAGLLPPEPEMKASYREALHLFARLPEQLQRTILIQMRALLEAQDDALIPPGSQRPASKTTS